MLCMYVCTSIDFLFIDNPTYIFLLKFFSFFIWWLFAILWKPFRTLEIYFCIIKFIFNDTGKGIKKGKNLVLLTFIYYNLYQFPPNTNPIIFCHKTKTFDIKQVSQSCYWFAHYENEKGSKKIKKERKNS